MQELEERIQSEGTVKAGNVLKGDAVLNHQCDVRLFDRMGSAWAAHFAGKVSIDFFHLRFDQRVTGAGHHTDAAAGLNVRTNVACALNIVNDNGTGFMSKDIAGKQQRLTVRENNFAVLGHNAQTVSVAVIGNTDFGIAFTEHLL